MTCTPAADGLQRSPRSTHSPPQAARSSAWRCRPQTRSPHSAPSSGARRCPSSPTSTSTGAWRWPLSERAAGVRINPGTIGSEKKSARHRSCCRREGRRATHRRQRRLAARSLRDKAARHRPTPWSKRPLATPAASTLGLSRLQISVKSSSVPFTIGAYRSSRSAATRPCTWASRGGHALERDHQECRRDRSSAGRRHRRHRARLTDRPIR